MSPETHRAVVHQLSTSYGSNSFDPAILLFTARDRITDSNDEGVLIFQRSAIGIGEETLVREIATELETRQEIVDQLHLLGQRQPLQGLRYASAESLGIIENLKARRKGEAVVE